MLPKSSHRGRELPAVKLVPCPFDSPMRPRARSCWRVCFSSRHLCAPRSVRGPSRPASCSRSPACTVTPWSACQGWCFMAPTSSQPTASTAPMTTAHFSWSSAAIPPTRKISSVCRQARLEAGTVPLKKDADYETMQRLMKTIDASGKVQMLRATLNRPLLCRPGSRRQVGRGHASQRAPRDL